MSCPLCEQTMQNVGMLANTPTFWCPNCGTLKNDSLTPTITAPKYLHGKMISAVDEAIKWIAKATQPDIDR